MATAKSRSDKTQKRARRPLPITRDNMTSVIPLTDNQKKFCEAFDDGKNIFAYGTAGTGKTFMALYKALEAALSPVPAYESVYLVRSMVATREIGFLPGGHDDKCDIYQTPYKEMVKYLFELPSDDAFTSLYQNLQAQGTLKFLSTSFLRGLTLDNVCVIVDETANLNFHELDSIITRIGTNSRIIFCGDAEQSDLIKTNERNGIHDFMEILRVMEDDFTMIEYDIEDIVRSGLVKNYLITKKALGKTMA
jgi:phosphate starvation-inducible PhoH-like protein